MSSKFGERFSLKEQVEDDRERRLEPPSDHYTNLYTQNPLTLTCAYMHTQTIGDCFFQGEFYSWNNELSEECLSQRCGRLGLDHCILAMVSCVL